MPSHRQSQNRILKAALAYPETCEENPWGERVAKVRGKVFLFTSVFEKRLGITTKLPITGAQALLLPFTQPCGYGLGKHGWISSRFAQGEDVPVELLLEWLDESFRAVAPKRLIKLHDQGGVAPPPKPKRRAGSRATTRRVLLAGMDTARLKRARLALKEAGVGQITTATHAQLARRLARKPDLVVFDLGRLFVDGLELAADLVEQEKLGPELVFVGVRDARLARKVKQAVPGRDAYKGPPGDPGVVSAMLLRLEA